MAEEYKVKLSPHSSSEVIEVDGLKLINEITSLHNLLREYKKILNPAMLTCLKDINEPKQLKFNMMLKLYLSRSK